MFTLKNNKLVRVAVTTIFLVAGGAFGIALISRIDEVITAEGIVKVVGQDISIKSPFDGTIIKVFVENGEFINKGESIFKFDDSNYIIELNRTKKELLTLEENYVIQEKILNKFDFLFNEGAISELSYLNEKKELKNIILKISEAKSSIKKLEILISKSLIKSPVKGNVFDLNITGNNYETLKGERLAGIIPDRNLEAKAFVPNKNIGFIKPNMEVKISIDSHPYSQFGYLYGNVEKVEEVNLNSTKDFIPSQIKYPVFIKLKKQYLEKNDKKYTIRNGQSMTASFNVRSKPFIALFSDLFEKISDSVTKVISKKSLFLQNSRD